jgi:hypothetical protein
MDLHSGQFLGGADSKRSGNEERAARAGLAFHPDPAAHHLDEPFAGREAETHTAELPRRRGIGLAERLKRAADLLRRHADSGFAARGFQRHAIGSPRFDFGPR